MKEYIHEQAKEIEVFDHCDVLVVGAGPAGTAAAVIRFGRCGEKETAWLLLLAGCAGILFVFAPHPRYYVSRISARESSR